MIIDTPENVSAKLSQLKAAGVTSIIRYLNPLWPAGEKNVKHPEAAAIARAGLKLGLVNEGWGDFAHSGISAGAGERDATYSFAAAKALGANPGQACVYFAVDTDATNAQIQRYVLPYFAAISSVNDAHYGGLWRVGVYGSGNVCEAVKASKHASCAWLSCSMGWGGSRAYAASGKWALKQHLPTHLVGVDVDTNDANGDWGDFVPAS